MRHTTLISPTRSLSAVVQFGWVAGSLVPSFFFFFFFRQIYVHHVSCINNRTQMKGGSMQERGTSVFRRGGTNEIHPSWTGANPMSAKLKTDRKRKATEI